MIKKVNIKIIYVLVSSCLIHAALAGGDSKAKKSKAGQRSAPIEIQDETAAKAEHKYIKGMGYFLQQDFNSALKEFKDALTLNPENAAVNYKIAESYYLLNYPIKAITYAQDAIKYGEKNKYYHILLANIYMDGQEYLNAAITYEKMLSLVNDANEYYYDVAEIYQQLGVNELKKKLLFAESTEKGVKRKIRSIEVKAISYLNKSIQAYSKLEESYGITPEITLEKQKIFLLLGKKEEAFKAGDKLVNSDIDNVKYRLAQAELYYKHGTVEQAIDYLNLVINEFPAEPRPYLLIYQFLVELGRLTEANNHLETAFSNKSMHIDAKVKFISSLISIPGNEDLALRLAEQTVISSPDKAQAHSVKGDILYLKGDNESARLSYMKALELDSAKQLIWEQVILLDSKDQKYDLLIQDSDKALRAFPENSVFWFYQGLGYMLQKKYDSSVGAFESGLVFANDNFRLKNQFLANLGDAYNELGDYVKSDSSYEAVLESEPNNARVLNNYSYFLSLRDDRLDEAKAMIEKAVRMNPTDPTYLDTYGWVLYKMKDYDGAKIQLEKALLETDDATVVEHYGDVLYKLGNVDEAIAHWQKAKESGLDTEILNKKIADGKIYE